MRFNSPPFQPPPPQNQQEPKERVKRPDFGSKGRAIKLRANYFAINVQVKAAMFYRVDIKQVRRGGAEPMETDDAPARAFPRAKARAVMDALAKDQNWNPGWAYDDQHTLVCHSYFIDQAEHSYEVSAVLPDRDRPSRFTVTVKYTSSIALEDLNEYCKYDAKGGCGGDVPHWFWHLLISLVQVQHGAAAPHCAAGSGHHASPRCCPSPPEPPHRLWCLL